MSVLDDQFGFTKSSNVSIAQVWFSPRFAARYEPAYAALENLLTRVGRRRLIVSPYRDLAATPEGKVRAREIFANAREGYHPIRAFSLSAFRFSAFPPCVIACMNPRFRLVLVPTHFRLVMCLVGVGASRIRVAHLNPWEPLVRPAGKAQSMP
jgi:hypothetical protein